MSQQRAVERSRAVNKFSRKIRPVKQGFFYTAHWRIWTVLSPPGLRRRTIGAQSFVRQVTQFG
jgi:hypothetical protein